MPRNGLRCREDACSDPSTQQKFDLFNKAEKTRLTSWKKYRVLLNRVDTLTAPDISWPDLQ
ncbi:tail fiber assembly protein [Escherichia coli]|nr:tail fiber assembly protein [Escherichia coli]NUE65567.1 tail fiber assembly protein [Escherichia coli]